MQNSDPISRQAETTTERQWISDTASKDPYYILRSVLISSKTVVVIVVSYPPQDTSNISLKYIQGKFRRALVARYW